jgi:Tol biopolymer transport system component
MTGIESRNTAGIWLTEPDLSSAARIKTDTFGVVGNARVSPDGSRVAFQWSSHVWLTKTDGTERVQLTSSCNEERYPTWSPDGRYLLVYFTHACEGEQGGVYLISTASRRKILQLRDAGGQLVTPLSPMTWR